MAEHKAVEPVAYAYYRVSNSRKVLSHTAIYKENWPVHLTKPLGIIESNTTTIPTAEYEQLKADAERYKLFSPDVLCDEACMYQCTENFTCRANCIDQERGVE